MADSDPGERDYDSTPKTLSDLNKDLEKLLEEMEKVSGRSFPRQNAFSLVAKSSSPPFTSELKSSAFLTRPSLSTSQLLYCVSTMSQNLTLTTEYHLEWFSILCVVATYFWNWTVIFESRNSDFFCNWAQYQLHPSSSTQQMTNDVSITPVNKTGTFFLYII